MKKVLAVDKFYCWRILRKECLFGATYYRLQNCNGLWWSTVAEINSAVFFDVCDDWVEELNLIWVDYI